jgi:hypothetical protein
VVAFAIFATTMDAAVWQSWHMTSPLLPLAVVGACLLAAPRAAPRLDHGGSTALGVEERRAL